MQDSKKGEGRAEHGYRNEVTWDEGKGRQPYANQGEVEGRTSAAPQAQGGNAGEAAGRNDEQMEAVKGFPDDPASGARRKP